MFFAGLSFLHTHSYKQVFYGYIATFDLNFCDLVWNTKPPLFLHKCDLCIGNMKRSMKISFFPFAWSRQKERNLFSYFVNHGQRA